MSRRLLLVGGSAGTGKSTVARTVATRIGAAWLQLDTLWIAMRDAAPGGSEERRRLDIDRRIREQAEPAETLLAPHRRLGDGLPHALAFELQTRPIVVADGAWLLPDFVSCLELADVDIASMFLHESDRMQLERAMSCRRDVVMVAPRHAESVRLAWLYGNWLANEAGPPRCRSLASRPCETAPDRALALTRVLPQG